jgi:outer membrane protein assembly factor BamD (BamD/ComL family)
MKKNIIIMIVILIGLYFIFRVFNMNAGYFPEKLYFQALKAEEQITANPEAATRKMMDRVELKLTRILQLFPNSEVARKADIRLGEFYIRAKRYGLAIAHLDKVIQKLERDRERLAMAYYLKGAACEKEDRWTDALRQYRVVRDNYSDTQIGLQIPLHIWSYYTVNGREAEAKQAYDDAVQFYKRIESENSDKPLGFMASLFLIRTYGMADDNDAAVASIEEHINKYYSPATVGRIVPLIEKVVVDRFKSPAKAVEIYTSILEKTKDPKLTATLEKRISELSAQIEEVPQPVQEPAKAQ